MPEWDAFDLELADSMTDLTPPEQTLRAVTPWRDAVRRIVLGLCLTCFTLSFWYLQYVLPAIGAVELYLGFRTLRRTNSWFRAGWIISACKAILLYCNLLLLATPFSGKWSAALPVLSSVLTFFLFLFLRQGLRQAASSIAQTPKRDPALWACLWYLVLMALALFWPQPGFGVFAVMVYAFCRIVKALLAAAAELEDWGYTVRAAPVRTRARQLRRLFFASLLALVLLASLASNHLAIDGAPVEQTSESAETAGIRTRLAALGFPAEQLGQLPETELESLAEADACCFEAYTPSEHPNQANVPFEVTFTTVYVRLAERTIRTYHFFSLPEETPRTVWQNQITVYTNSDEQRPRDITGQLRWTSDGTAMAADLPLELAEELTYFGSTQYSCQAAFSFPFHTADRQGWAAFTTDLREDWFGMHSSIYYEQQPYKSFYPWTPLSNAASRRAWADSVCSLEPFQIDP